MWSAHGLHSRCGNLRFGVADPDETRRFHQACVSFTDPHVKSKDYGSHLIMEVMAVLFLTVVMVGIGWMANDRGDIRTSGTEATRGAEG